MSTTVTPAPTAIQPVTYLTVTSASTPALNGIYGIEGVSGRGMQAQVNAVALNSTFADGTESLNWPDKSNVPHAFTIAQFKTLATAVALYRAQWAQYVSGITTTAPSSSVTIP